MSSTLNRRTSAVAWGASLAVHSLLTAGVLWYGSRGGMDTGGGDSPEREVGIVLRQSSQPPAPFDSESETESDAVELIETEPSKSTSEGPLPPSPFSDLVAQLMEERVSGRGPPSSDGGSAAPAQPPPGGGARPKLPIGQAKVRFYGVEGVGSRFVFALDRSISMRGGRLRSAKAELIQSLETLGPSHQFHILFFNTRVAPIDLAGRGRIAFGTEENKRLAARRVRGVSADGGTVRKTALDYALRFGPDVIFFLTDDDTPMSPGEMGEILGQAIGATTIHTVEFGQGPDHGRQNFLTELAAGTGGERCYVDTSRLPR